MYRQRRGEIPHGLSFSLEGCCHADVRTKEHHAGVELPKTLVMPRSKNWPRKSLQTAKGKSNCCRRRRTEWAVRIQAARRKYGIEAVRGKQESGAGRSPPAAEICFAGCARLAGCNSAGAAPAGDQQGNLPRLAAPPTRRFGKSPGRPRTLWHGARPQGRPASKGRTSAGKDAEENPHGHSANRTLAFCRRKQALSRNDKDDEPLKKNSKGGRSGADHPPKACMAAQKVL